MKLTKHAKERMAERGISLEEELNALGRYYDSIVGTAEEKSEWDSKSYTLEELGAKDGFEAGRKILAMKTTNEKIETISIQLPKPLVAAIKRQARSISVPWTSYIREALEVRVGKRR